MKIIIIRRGKVNYPPITMLSAYEFKTWVVCYNTNELDRSLVPPEDAMMIAKEAKIVVCSELPRSVESAKMLGVNGSTLTHSIFNEADLPIATWSFP